VPEEKYRYYRTVEDQNLQLTEQLMDMRFEVDSLQNQKPNDSSSSIFWFGMGVITSGLFLKALD
jgi:hypothetical protein